MTCKTSDMILLSSAVLYVRLAEKLDAATLKYVTVSIHTLIIRGIRTML